MKAHHLSCGTMRVPTVPTLVSHILLLETDVGLVLVDKRPSLIRYYEQIGLLPRRRASTGSAGMTQRPYAP